MYLHSAVSLLLSDVFHYSIDSIRMFAVIGMIGYCLLLCDIVEADEIIFFSFQVDIDLVDVLIDF